MLWQKKWDQSATGRTHDNPASALSLLAEDNAGRRSHDELAMTSDLSNRRHKDFDRSSAIRGDRCVFTQVALTNNARIFLDTRSCAVPDLILPTRWRKNVERGFPDCAS